MSALACHDEFASEADRIARILDREAPQASLPDGDDAASRTIGEAVSAAARAVGVTIQAQDRPREGEDIRAAIERIAVGNGLIARPVSLAEALRGESVAPVVAIARDASVQSGAVLARKGNNVTRANRASRWRPMKIDAERLDAYEPTGIMLTPALPDGALSSRKLLSFGLRQARPDLLVFAATSLAAGGLGALVPLLIAPLFSVVVPEGDRALLAQIAIFLAGVFIASLAVRYATAIAKLRLDGRIGMMLRIAAIDRAMRVADAESAKGSPRPPAPIAALSARCIEQWHRGVWGLALALAGAILVAAPSVAVLGRASPGGAAIVALVFLAGLAGGAAIARRRARALASGMLAPQSWMTTAYEALSKIDTVRAGAAETRFFSRYTDGFLSLRHRFLRADRVGVTSNALESGFEAALAFTAICALALAGALAEGPLAASFVVATGVVAGAGSAVIGALGEATMLGLQRRMIGPLIDFPLPARQAAPRLHEPGGRIAMIAVSARPAPSAPLVLRDISFEIEPGEHIGLVGASGSGKSTLLKVMLGLLPAEEGTVLYDGIGLSMVDPAALRRRIGIIGQSGRLFPGTLFDNVAAGMPVSSEAATEALMRAGFGPTLAALPLGLGTPIGDAASVFSGGEVQRILLARAFVGEPKILVLDEATSALDPVVEEHVFASIEAMRATVINVSHKVDKLHRCDRIMVIDDGRIMEIGDFDTLAQAGGLFARYLSADAAMGAVPGNPVHQAQEVLHSSFARETS
ncbi:MAG: ATP-binding cassette domain-containing protein [Salinarimonas sp.]|nr:ATP-binding cassette domain-containing protein [Salinarimonas sp.]